MEQEEVKKDLELAAAEESAEKKQKFQTETLNVVFTIYFRMLKSRPNPRLLSVCLEGLAK
jgi:nucleolar complex protein 3